MGFIWVFIRPIVEEIEQNMRGMELNTVMVPIKKSDTNGEILDKIREANVQAVISLHYGNAELFTALEEMEIPVVVVMNGNFQDMFYSVCVDDYQGAYEGTLHLIKLGAQKHCVCRGRAAGPSHAVKRPVYRLSKGDGGI